LTNSNQPELSGLTRTQVLVTIAISAIVFLALTKLWLYFSSLSLFTARSEPWDYVIGMGLGIGITLMGLLVYWLWPGYRRSVDSYLNLVLPPLTWADLILLGPLPGLSEELFFRGTLLPTFGLNTEGVLLTAVCFGLLHFSKLENWPYVIWAIIVGTILGVSTLWTDNLLVPVIAHIVTNGLSGGFWKWRTLGGSGIAR